MANRWTKDEDDYLERWAGRKSLQSIGRHLGRTSQACVQRLTRLGTSARSNTGAMSPAEVAEVYGCSAEKVRRLITNGQLRAETFRGRSKRWLIDPKDAAGCRQLSGSQIYGSANCNARLTDADVAYLRELHANGWNYLNLAEAFGVGRRTVRNVAERKSWKHVKDWWQPNVSTG